MAEQLPVALALIIHFLFRIALFVQFPISVQCFGVIPSLIILTSVVVTLLDSHVLPEKFKGLPGMKAVEIGVEAILCLLFVEVAMGIVWSPIENITSRLLTQVFKGIYGRRFAGLIATCIVSAVASQVLSFSLIATGKMQAVKIHVEKAMMSLISLCCRQRNAIPSAASTRKPAPATSQCPPCPPPVAGRQGAGDHRPRSRGRSQCWNKCWNKIQIEIESSSTFDRNSLLLIQGHKAIGRNVLGPLCPQTFFFSGNMLLEIVAAICQKNQMLSKLAWTQKQLREMCLSQPLIWAKILNLNQVWFF